MATPLPAAADFTGPSVTEGTFKTKLTDMRTFLADLLGTDGTEATALAALQAPFGAANGKTGAYSLLSSDRGKVIYYTGTGGVTLTLPVTSTTDFGIGYMCSVANQSSGVITIQRTSTDTVDGLTSFGLNAGESCILFISAAGKWVTFGKPVSNGEYRTTQVFTSSGTWTKPTGLKRIKVTVVGGGGGGGGGNGLMGSGGGGGGASIEWLEASALAATETVTIGGGGAYNGTTGIGATGGTSTFGTTAKCSATGGAGGSTNNGIGGLAAGGSGGIGSGGNLNIGGQAGGTSLYSESANGMTGAGGSSHLGGGGKSATYYNAAESGRVYGGGGGGGGNMTPGNGAAGVVIVEEFY